MYTCDHCGNKVDYGDWFPIRCNLHWCRGCVSQYFGEIPVAEQERGRQWLKRRYRDGRDMS